MLVNGRETALVLFSILISQFLTTILKKLMMYYFIILKYQNGIRTDIKRIETRNCIFFYSLSDYCSKIMYFS